MKLPPAGGVHDEEEIEAVIEVLRTSDLALGPAVAGHGGRGGRTARQAARRDGQLRARRRCGWPSTCSTSSPATRSSPRRSRSRPTSRRWCSRASSRSSSTSTRDSYQIEVGGHRRDGRPAHQGDPRAEPVRQRARLGRHPVRRRRARPRRRRGLLRRPRLVARRRAHRHPQRHLRHQLRPYARA